MEKNMTSPRHGAPPWRRIGQLATVVAVATVVGVLAPMGAAFAGTPPSPSDGTGQVTLTGGSLSIGPATTNTIPVDMSTFSGIGLLPTAVWSDATGTGNGWLGQVAVSDFTYTGVWSSTTTGAASDLVSTPLLNVYTGTQDGVVYTVTVTSTSSDTVYFNWASTDTTDSLGSQGIPASAEADTSVAVGTQGIAINFGSVLPQAGTVYQIQAGTQAPDALSLSTSAGTVAAVLGTTGVSPVLGSDTTGVVGPTSSVDVAQTLGTAVPFVTAVANTGMGSYTVNPGVTFHADVNSWANTYTANVEYSFVAGP
jgi:hypothetical protein